MQGTQAMETNQEQLTAYAKQYGQVVAKAWADDDFKQRLLADPAATLQAEGITVPQGVELRAVENTDKVMYLMLPPKPSAELSDEQLDLVAGGNTSTVSCGGAMPPPGMLTWSGTMIILPPG